MFEILKSVIINGGYKLTEIQKKIKKLYVLGDLSEEQTDELLSMVSVGVSTDAERPEMLKLIQTLADKIESIESRLKALETPSGDESESTEEYEIWQPWDGISNKYQNGDIVKHNNKLWVSNFNGQNVWEPGTPGTESLWVLFEN